MHINDLPKRYQQQVNEQIDKAINTANKRVDAVARGNARVASMVRSEAESRFELQCNTLLDDVMQPEQEYRFHDTRKWRFDFAWPELLFAVEVEGITPGGGRHQRMDGFTKDLEKYEAAMLAGWTVYRCSPEMVKKGTAIATVERMLVVLTS